MSSGRQPALCVIATRSANTPQPKTIGRSWTVAADLLTRRTTRRAGTSRTRECATPGASAGVGFRIRAVPDTSLRMPGPLLETDQRGIVVRQDSLNAPGYAVGSPLRPIYALLFDCIRDNSAVRGTGPKGVVTLEDLIFTRQRGCGNMQIFRFESGPPAFDPNVALLNVPTTGFRRFNVATQYQLLYVPHGKKPDAGYDLQLTPLQYGASGIRSYMLTGGTAHVTWEQRRATIADPLADACERDLSQPCSR
jgi:hypothetical protein